MEEKVLWKDSEKQGPVIYKVIEYYDFSSYDPKLISTIFLDKGLAVSFYNQRIKEIPKEIWGYDDKEIEKWVTISTEGWGGSIYLTNYNDNVNVFLECDRIQTTPNSSFGMGSDPRDNGIEKC